MPLAPVWRGADSRRPPERQSAALSMPQAHSCGLVVAFAPAYRLCPWGLNKSKCRNRSSIELKFSNLSG